MRVYSNLSECQESIKSTRERQRRRYSAVPNLGREGFDAWLDSQRISGGAVWSTEIEHEANTRQVTIALLSPGSYTSEICRAEQLRALDKGNRVIPVLAVKSTDRPLYLYARQYRDFTDDANYASRLSKLVADIRGDNTATLPDVYRKTRVTYLTAPRSQLLGGP